MKERDNVSYFILAEYDILRFRARRKFFAKWLYNKREFGRNIEQLYNEGIINNDLHDRLNYLRRLLNYAKHDTDPNRDNTFDSEDAIVFYFECRYVGNELLKILNHPTCSIIYDIDDNF